jgi:hypothetical protein
MAGPAVTVKFRGPWDALTRALGPNFQKNLEAEGARAMQINLKLLEREVRDAIRNADSRGPANSFLTLDLKGGTSPLIDSGKMFNAVGSQYHSWKFGQVGITGKEGAGTVKAAKIVHEGAQIRVTTKMFNMFLLLHRLSLSYDVAADLSEIKSRRVKELWAAFEKYAPGRIFPKVTRGVLIVPERPFLRWAAQEAKDDIFHNVLTMVVKAITREPGLRASPQPSYRT